MKNILISGGAGFIGSNICQKLLQLGYNITVLDSLSQQVHGSNPEKTSALYKSISGKVNFINGSVIKRKDWMKALTNQDAVIHLAAETGTGQSMYKIKKYISVNIDGTALLLDILTNEKHSLKKIIVASSRAIYGEGKYFCEKDGNVYPLDRKQQALQKGDYECKCPICNGKIHLLPTDEESKILPKSVYAITKHNQEQMVLTVGAALGIPSVAFRYQNVYGPGQSLSNPYTGILSIFSTQIKNRNNINVFEDGKESRDFVYIDDVVNATILGLRNNTVDNNVFNVGYGKPIDVITISNLLRSKYDSDVEINISGNYRLGDIRHNYADISKIKTCLGFTPEIDFARGLDNFCEWVNSQEIQNDNYQDSIDELKKRGFYR